MRLNSHPLFHGILAKRKIFEQGTHTELLANQGMYYELYRTGFQEQMSGLKML